MTTGTRNIGLALLLLFLLFGLPAPAGADKAGIRRPDGARIEQLTGLKGKLDEKENVFKVSLPRADIAAAAAGVKLSPGLGLTAWAAFTPAGAHTMVMGDMVMTEDQVNAVMDVALAGGLDVTALHNHFFWDSPKVMFMHIGGMGDEEKLAAAVGRVFAKIKETAGGKGTVPKADIDPARSTFDPKKIEAILGPGEYKDGVFKVTIGRTTQMGGHAMGKAMGVNTWAAFAGTDEQALVDGDFAMTEAELTPVLKALRGAGIQIVAIHNHMTGEQPRIMILHDWGIGAPERLANGVRAGLDVTEGKGAR